MAREKLLVRQPVRHGRAAPASGGGPRSGLAGEPARAVQNAMAKDLESKIYFGLLLVLCLTDLGLALWVMAKAGPGTSCTCATQVHLFVEGPYGAFSKRNIVQFSLLILFQAVQLLFDHGGHKGKVQAAWNVVLGAFLLFSIGWTIFGWYVLTLADQNCCDLMWQSALACCIISTGACAIMVLTALPPPGDEEPDKTKSDEHTAKQCLQPPTYGTVPERRAGSHAAYARAGP